MGGANQNPPSPLSTLSQGKRRAARSPVLPGPAPREARGRFDRNSARPRFPIILAADVLYEKRDVQPLLSLVDQLLAPDGVLWLAEPGRPPALHFVETALSSGWRDSATQHPGPWPDPQDEDVIVNVHRLRR